MSVYRLKGTAGSVINQSFALGEPFVFGSSADCEVQIAEPGVAARHAEITWVDDKSLLLKDLDSRTGTLLNGEPVLESRLRSGDEIHIGSCRWILQAPGLRPNRVLTADAVKTPGRIWPRVFVWTVLGAAVAAVVVFAWQPEWLDILRSMLE